MNSIKQALSNIIEGNLDAMRQNFANALMEKAVSKLEEKKIDIAQSYFGKLEEQELTSSQAYQMGRGVQALANRPFGRPGFNTQGRSAMTGSAQGNVPGVGSGRITASRVDAPGGYSQATVSATRPSGSPIGTARMDDKGARMTSIGANRIQEMKEKEDDSDDREEMRGPAIQPKKKMLVRKMKKV